jgi:hypothetical protein
MLDEGFAIERNVGLDGNAATHLSAVLQKFSEMSYVAKP